MGHLPDLAFNQVHSGKESGGHRRRSGRGRAPAVVHVAAEPVAGGVVHNQIIRSLHFLFRGAGHSWLLSSNSYNIITIRTDVLCLEDHDDPHVLFTS
ncbi:MAG: hypothetical protein A2427_02250 [Candidatus Nealsonbacteria bacterium RIFOXYC1_FULL_40_7]|uniref:Uncharacterized protein n=1 Tax=Candidatus Nealsonbacteria bacterium RIFOXYC1_FULL_40_7 TaxID=1801678 RepID=A0A1G2ETA6_9BACT|nr:MAG: hypothetical protein A2427_02250 [Candidatus Nealsonbacteria bacterium RIFOXYC1_FULL_40_7]